MSASAADGFRVTPWIHTLGGLVHRHPRVWRWLGDLETRVAAEQMAGIAIDRPIYVSGLARSGSTILLEVLARHADTVTHRYRDYPLIFTPWWWNRYLDRLPAGRGAAPAERSHGDGIMVTPESPEAFEEVLWMAFFPDLHDPAVPFVLDGGTDHPAFASFYRDHLRKLLSLRQGRRYLSKGNYNVTRLDYLLRLFPDARFVVPVRDPVWHIASLMKQHRLFCEGVARHPRALDHLRRVGHFEFGPDRRPINIGDKARTAEIQTLWRDGAEVAGWARYWADIHSFLADRLAANPALRAATHIVRFEDLCRAPREILGGMLAHCGLPDVDAVAAEAAGGIRFPGYYTPRFTRDELETIARETGPTAARFGYGSPSTAAQASG